MAIRKWGGSKLGGWLKVRRRWREKLQLDGRGGERDYKGGVTQTLGVKKVKRRGLLVKGVTVRAPELSLMREI